MGATDNHSFSYRAIAPKAPMPLRTTTRLIQQATTRKRGAKNAARSTTYTQTHINQAPHNYRYNALPPNHPNSCTHAIHFTFVFITFPMQSIAGLISVSCTTRNNPRPTGGAISSPPLVFLRYLLNQCRYHHQTCSTLSPNNFTHCVKILKSRVL